MVCHNQHGSCSGLRDELGDGNTPSCPTMEARLCHMAAPRKRGMKESQENRRKNKGTGNRLEFKSSSLNPQQSRDVMQEKKVFNHVYPVGKQKASH